jgi:hypothetical protein
MNLRKSRVALAITAALGAASMGTAIDADAGKTAGKYVAGDFHNHTTCSDGSISMQKLVKKATDKVDTPWGLDWFVQAGHGNSGGTRNCTLVEDDSLSTPAYPFIPGTGPNTTWTASIGLANVKGDQPGTGGVNGYMWRWQAVQEYQYPLIEYLATLRDLPLFVGLESIVAGHEHSSMSVITGQMPPSLDTATLPTAPGPITARYTPIGNADALSQWAYCFDAGITDLSRGNQTGTSIGNNWDCSVTGSLNASNPQWSASGHKLVPTAPVGTNGHLKTQEALKWMNELHAGASYYVPAHLERAGPFNPNGNNGYNVEHLRNFNNVSSNIAFGMETQPGHGASDARGEYTIRRNNFGGGVLVDSVGGTTYGGTGVYGAQIGGVWDALLGEGRRFWFFASSDWHSRGSFGPDDRRSTADFFPGEYQRNYTMVRNGSDPKLRPQMIVDGLRTGNNFAASGQLIDRLAFIACASYSGLAFRSNAAVENLALGAAMNNTDIDTSGCATMGEKLKVRPGAEIVVSIVVRDPSGTNYSPYTFDNPSLAQVGISQPINAPVLDHVDVIRGMVTGFRDPLNVAMYAGEWPRDWVQPYLTGGRPTLDTVPDAAKNTSAGVIQTFNGATWTAHPADAQFKKMTFRIPAVSASQYVRLRGTNMPANVPFETDGDANPLPDVWTNAAAISGVSATGANLRIPCTATSGATQFDHCPDHLQQFPANSGNRFVSFDVAAWSDLWFYSNPIFVEVSGSTPVAGIQ